MEEKLDRALANERWRHISPVARVLNEDNYTTDHTLLILELGGGRPKHKPRFRFENAWIGKDARRNIISKRSKDTEGSDITYQITERTKRLAEWSWGKKIYPK